MQIFIDDTYEAASKRAADDILSHFQSLSQPVLCVASGDSPKGLYKELSNRQSASLIDTSNWFFLGLDEWVGLGRNDEGSCRFMLNRDVFEPLGVQKEKICCFDGTAKSNDECERIERFIKQRGGIDIALLGLGMNGHIGLNEPGTSPLLYSHLSVIDEVTKKVGQKYFSRPQTLSEGITLGLATLMQAKHLFLLASGEKKAAILQQALEGEITENIPASIVRAHPHFTVYADKEAAGLLTNKS